MSVCATIPVFVIRHTQRMRTYYIVVCELSGCIVFFTLSPNRHSLRKMFVEHKICFKIYSTTFV